MQPPDESIEVHDFHIKTILIFQTDILFTTTRATVLSRF